MYLNAVALQFIFTETKGLKTCSSMALPNAQSEVHEKWSWNGLHRALTSILLNTFGINWNDDCEPGHLSAHGQIPKSSKDRVLNFLTDRPLMVGIGHQFPRSVTLNTGPSSTHTICWWQCYIRTDPQQWQKGLSGGGWKPHTVVSAQQTLTR